MQMPKTIRIKNGEKVNPTFSAQEYANRQAKLRAYLAQNNIDAAVFTSYHNINYYSDFVYCSFGRSIWTGRDPGQHRTISANIDGGQPCRRSVGRKHHLYRLAARQLFRCDQQALARAGRIGVEFDHLNLLNRTSSPTAIRMPKL